MPRFAINVLCQNSDEICTHVRKDFMADYKIENAKDTDDFDHVGIKEFATIEKASEEARRLKRDSNGDILDISVSPA